MLVVVDANIIISLMIAEGSKHKLFFSEHIEAKSPDILLFEIGKYWDEISERSRLSEDNLGVEFSVVRMQIDTSSLKELSKWLKRGAEVSPDPDDAEYFALALKLNCPIWSEDKLLKEQSEVKVFNTKELIEELGL